MNRQFFKSLLLGALHAQSGDYANIYLSRVFLCVTLSTGLYLASLAHNLIPDQFIAFSKLGRKSLFSLKSFDGSYLMAGTLTIVLIINLLSVYDTPLVEEFLASKRKGMHCMIF